MKKVALQLYSVRRSLKQDFWGTLRAVRAMGYTGVEGFGSFPCTAQEFKAALDDTGLEIVGWHQDIAGLQADTLIATVTYNKVLGNSRLAVPWMDKECFADAAACAATAKQLEDAALALQPYGITLGYHNHTQEYDHLIDGKIPMDLVLQDAPHVFYQLDCGNALHGNGDIYSSFDRFPGRFETVHAKPFSKKDGMATMIGSDDVDWARFLKLSFGIGAAKWAIVEYEVETLYPELKGVELALENIVKYL